MPTFLSTTRSALATLAPEDQVLIRCSQSHLDTAERAVVSALLSQTLDWDYIFDASIRHNVSPLFYAGLNQVTSDTPRHAELEALYRNNRARNRRIYGVLTQIASAFARADIRAIGLKDIQLAREVYPDPGLRPIGDLDILIRRKDYSHAVRELRALGFVITGSDIPFTVKYGWGHHFHRAEDNVWVDLQWNIVQREWDTFGEGNFNFEIERMWRNARPMSLGDAEILVPSPEDMLVHLCQHLEGHAYGELVLFCDIAELIRHYKTALDWDYITGLADKYDARSTLYYTLTLVDRMYPVPLPPNVWERLAPGYFQANLFAPLYENLTDLHVELDQIYKMAQPPEPTMRKFERATRRRAHGAMLAYRALNQLARDFAGAGGRVCIFDGRALETGLPDPALAPFEEIQCFILESDLPLMRQALSAGGFLPASDHGAECYAQVYEVHSVDPALDRATEMAIEARIQNDAAGLLGDSPRDVSTRAIALESLGGKLRGHPSNEPCLGVPLAIWALSPENLMLYLMKQLGSRQQNRLFALPSALDLLRTFAGPLNWGEITRAADEHQVAASVCRGREILAAFTDDPRVPSSACTDEPARVFQSARYTVSWGRYGAFRPAFFSLFALVWTDGVMGKWRYFAHSHLPQQMVQGVRAFLRRPKITVRDFAYWIE